MSSGESSDFTDDDDSSSTDSLKELKRHYNRCPVIYQKRNAFNIRLPSKQVEDLFPLNSSFESVSSLSLNHSRQFQLYLVLKLYLIMGLLVFTVLFAFFLLFGQVFALSVPGPQLPEPSIVEKNDTGDYEQTLQQTYQISLDSNNDKYRMFWTVDYFNENVLFEIRLKLQSPLDWFAFGFSEYGFISNADLCLVWFDKRKKLHFDDLKSDNESFALLDQHSNDCHFIKAKRKGRVLRIAFRRKFDTCDQEDYIIDEGTTHLVYATGPGPIARVESLRLQNYQHGFQRAQLLKPGQPLAKLPSYIKMLEILNQNITVPAVETTYWCRLMKLPEDFSEKIHLVQYESVIQSHNEGLVHHMELFHCEVDSHLKLPSWNGHCSDPQMPSVLKTCKRVIAAWAFGAGPMTYPKNVGLPLGGANYSLYVMLEMHYNNPQEKSGVVDSSGIRLYYTNRLRSVDAGILEIGLEYTDKNSIPPNSIMELRGYCVSECTRAALPPYGITIFASQLHTHLTGVSTWTQHVRGGIELDEINRDNHYSPHFQEIRKLRRPITVFPGDSLINVCRYDTRKRNQITLGGFAITDEMCVNYLHYFPKTNLEVCKSSIDTEHLKKYFRDMNRLEGQNTSSRFSVAENYRNIHWNHVRANRLDALYQSAPLSMQCNQSNGERFPGYWNGIPVTRITKPLKGKTRKCRLVMEKFNQDQTDEDEQDMDESGVEEPQRQERTLIDLSGVQT